MSSSVLTKCGSDSTHATQYVRPPSLTVDSTCGPTNLSNDSRWRTKLESSTCASKQRHAGRRHFDETALPGLEMALDVPGVDSVFPYRKSRTRCAPNFLYFRIPSRLRANPLQEIDNQRVDGAQSETPSLHSPRSIVPRSSFPFMGIEQRTDRSHESDGRFLVTLNTRGRAVSGPR
jgi:hypothetical protein